MDAAIISRLRNMKNDPRRLHRVAVDSEKCMGCRKCLKTCIYAVYEWDREHKVSEAAHSEECVACMQCAFFCPAGAITIHTAQLAFFDPLYDPFGLNDVSDGDGCPAERKCLEGGKGNA